MLVEIVADDLQSGLLLGLGDLGRKHRLVGDAWYADQVAIDIEDWLADFSWESDPRRIVSSITYHKSANGARRITLSPSAFNGNVRSRLVIIMHRPSIKLFLFLFEQQA